MSSRKVVHVNVSLNKGSTGRIAEQICSLAELNKWKSYIIYGPIAVNNSSINSIKCGNWLSNRFHAILSRLFDADGLGSIFATLSVVRKLNKINPDIVHLHVLHEHYINYPILFKYLAKSKSKIIWTMHDCWGFTGHCVHFDFVDCYNWKIGCNNCKHKKAYPKTLFSRSSKNYLLKKKLYESLSHKLTVIPVCLWLEKFVKQSLLKDCSIKTIYNGTDVIAFHPFEIKDLLPIMSKLGISKNQKVILGCAAVWSTRKGYNDFFKLKKRLSDNYVIILVGLSKSQYDEAKDSNIIGVVKTESIQELAMLYSLADVFVNPTYEDNFPTTNIEALSCGTPVVSYKTGGSCEAIDEKTGIKVEQGNINSLILAVETITNNGKFLYSKACRERALELYNKNERFMEYINLYNQLISENE